MSTSLYHDLLWDLALEGAGGRGVVVKLQVFANEHEMYETKTRSPQTNAIALPLDRRGLSKLSSDEWTRSRLPPDILLELGQRLWDSIPQMAKDLLVEATVDQLCRLKISSNSPVIDDLPWEWLNDGTIPFALRPGIRLVRSVPCPAGIAADERDAAYPGAASDHQSKRRAALAIVERD